MNSSVKEPWVIGAVECLHRAGSWTGRIHIHKLLFLVHVLGKENVPFDYELYHYGPYSFDLDEAIARMELFGDIEKYYREQGYGPSYQLSDIGRDTGHHLSSRVLEKLDRFAQEISHYNSKSLELIATCFWTKYEEKIDSKDSIIERVGEIKPKYSREEIADGLQRALDLEAKFAA